MAEKKDQSFKLDDRVEWETPQGKTRGRVIRKVIGTAKAGGHTAKASSDEPQIEVKSEKSGKSAIHKPGALVKIPKKSDNE